MLQGKYFFDSSNAFVAYRGFNEKASDLCYEAELNSSVVIAQTDGTFSYKEKTKQGSYDAKMYSSAGYVDKSYRESFEDSIMPSEIKAQMLLIG